MLSILQGRSLFISTATLWVLFLFTTFLNPTLALPSPSLIGDLVYLTTSAGLGVELEMGRVVIQGKRKLTAEEREKIKGAEMTPIGFGNGGKTKWKLTAELGSPELLPEAIIDGLVNKVGDHNTKSIGEEVYHFFV